jgi:SAM-dependent methyltransferase
MSPAHDDLPSAASMPAPTAAGFDEVFSAPASPGIRRVWELAEPDLSPEIEPLSFVSADLLRYVVQALDLSPGQTLVDLGCGRGGPGLWLTREAGVSLVGVDFSPVAVDQAAHRGRCSAWLDERGSSSVISPEPGFQPPAPTPWYPSTRSTSLSTRRPPRPRHAECFGPAGAWS